MSTTATTDLKLEAVVIPVSDVDRSKRFYDGLGWRLDVDFGFDNGFRVVQFTPPGSPASIQFGTNITNAEPGTAEGLYLVVSDVQAGARVPRRPGRRDQRGLPPRGPGLAVPADGRRGPRGRHRG